MHNIGIIGIGSDSIKDAMMEHHALKLPMPTVTYQPSSLKREVIIPTPILDLKSIPQPLIPQTRKERRAIKRKSKK